MNAEPPAAVAAGNVETSQRIADALLGALAQAAPDRVPAASQGTMNNILVGNDDFAYYETIGGGQGGRPGKAGMSGVHTGMTNTKNTPIEALEAAYPLKVIATRLRRGSGGGGRFPGGKGSSGRSSSSPMRRCRSWESGAESRRGDSPAANPARSVRTG